VKKGGKGKCRRVKRASEEGWKGEVPKDEKGKWRRRKNRN
jgi:hypothetical protein